MLNIKLKQLRNCSNWSKTEVANKLGIRLTTYHGYESGRAFPRDFNILLKIAKLYNISLDCLVGYECKIEFPTKITTADEAIKFINNLPLFLQNISNDEIINIANKIFYLIKNS